MTISWVNYTGRDTAADKIPLFVPADVVDGDMLIAVVASDHQTTWLETSGWNEITDDQHSTEEMTTSIQWRQAFAVGGSTVNLRPCGFAPGNKQPKAKLHNPIL